MLELKNVSFGVDDTNGNDGECRRTIVDKLDYTFEAGKFYAITGPNGSGKTTIAKLIMGINTVTDGAIYFKATDITGKSVTERANLGISYSFQHPPRFKGMTFRELLAIAAGTDDESSLTSLVARVGICSFDFFDKPVDEKLSGGEIKKIELATTIARNPELAIYDEPDTGIDLWTIDPMIDLLKKEQAEKGATTLVVSHNRSFLEAADTILLIRNGGISYEGDLNGIEPLLRDLSLCKYRDEITGVDNAGCYR